MKRYVKASAMKRSDLKAWIETRALPTLTCLAQLYVFPDNVNQNHWRKEVYVNFNKMRRVKKNNKLPTAQFIFDNSFEVYRDHLWRVIESVVAKESDFKPDYDRRDNDSMFENLVEDYFMWLSTKLSHKDVLNSEEVYVKLEELGL